MRFLETLGEDKQGGFLGRIGRYPRSPGAHLYEVDVNMTPYDMRQLFRKTSRYVKSHLCAPIEVVFGTSEGRAIVNESLHSGSALDKRLDDLFSHWGVGPSECSQDAPIFILSAGWRSGSTLLQRMIMDDKRVLIWGEPYDRAGIIQKLSDMWRPFTKHWPSDKYFADNYDSISNQDWIANLYPSIQEMQSSQIAMLDTMFRDPALRLGYLRWGIKEVRWTTNHAKYLKWLFPNARFVFIYRNPWSAYRSYKPWRRWFRKWPTEPVLTPWAFGKHWSEMVKDFSEKSVKMGGILVAYEELGVKVPELRNYLGIEVAHPDSLSIERGQNVRNLSLNLIEKLVLKIVTASARSRVGY